MDSAPASSEPKPWGYWATFGWAVLAFLVGQFVAIAVLALWQGRDLPAMLSRPFDGIAVTVVILVSNPVTIAIAVLAARITRWNAADYLGLVWPQRRDLVLGLIALVTLVAVCDAMLFLSGRDLVTPFQLESYRSAAEQGWLTAMWIAACIVAPAGEEVLFRGLMYRGWVQPPGRVWPGIVAISLAWAALHVQYDVFGIAQIFVVGLFLGWIRWRGGSTLLTFLLHGAFNLEGTIETVLKLHYFS
jgi:membrane protease YdiL (CAAX protease family)